MLMDYPIHYYYKKYGISILYFKGYRSILNYHRMYSAPKTVHIVANSEDPDEMPPCATFHQGLHCLPKYLLLSRTKRINWSDRSSEVQ